MDVLRVSRLARKERPLSRHKLVTAFGFGAKYGDRAKQRCTGWTNFCARWDLAFRQAWLA